MTDITTLITTTKPLILLDVDGVILHSFRNYTTKEDDMKLRKQHHNKEVPFDDLTVYNNGNVKWLHSPTVLEHIRQWNADAELVWLTSWTNRASTELAPALKLPNFPFSPLAVFDKNGRLDKRKTVDAHIAASHPDRLIIWVDDEIGHFKEFPCGENNVFSRPNNLLVSPFNGLCPHHIDMIEKVLANPNIAKDKTIEMFYPGIQIFLRG